MWRKEKRTTRKIHRETDLHGSPRSGYKHPRWVAAGGGVCPLRAQLQDTQGSSLKTKGFTFSTCPPRIPTSSMAHGLPSSSLFCIQQPEQFLKISIKVLTHAQIRTLRRLNFLSVPPTSFPYSPHSSHTGLFPVPTPGPLHVQFCPGIFAWPSMLPCQGGLPNAPFQIHNTSDLCIP